MSGGLSWNPFRILADVCHTVSKIILIYAIHRNRSAEGVSLITQIFYLVVFVARYIPPVDWDDGSLLHGGPWQFYWNAILKIFYILSSAYILLLMTRIYARTREREKAWKLAAFSAGPALLLSPFVMMTFKSKASWSFAEFAWTFSIMLESVCVLPQLLLLRQTTVPTVIDSYYLVALGSYRAFYLVNWLVRAVNYQYYDPVSVIFGLVQTALYIDFAWVYWTRQRVKLRGGAVVDGEDLSKGWLVKRLIGRRGNADDEEEIGAGTYGDGTADGRPKAQRTWGPRGISVSADDGTLESERDREREETQGLADPGAFEDDDDDEEETEHGKNSNKRFTDHDEH